jgi:hypothetical protein
MCESERERMEVMHGFYTDREGRRGSGKGPAVAVHLPLMAGGLCGRQERETKRNWRRGWARGLIAFYWSLKKEGKRDRRGNDWRRAAVRRKGRKPGEGDGVDRWGRCISGRGEKKKRKGKVGRCGEELGRWWGERGAGLRPKREWD